MTDEDRLRAAFEDGVPTPPATPDRADGARARASRRRRRRTAGTVGAAVLAVGLVALVPVLVDRDQPAPTYAGDVADLPCPDWSPEVTERGPDEVADDLVGARLCSGPGVGLPATDGVLTTGLDEIPPLVNDAADHDDDAMCTRELGQGYLLQLLHADGTTQAVSGELYGCGVTTVGGTQRSGAQALYDQVAALYAAQRDRSDPGCPSGPVKQPTTGPGELAAGAAGVRLCQGPGLTFQVPADALTTGVDRLTDLVNASPVSAPEGCNDDLGTGYALVFGYPDGSSQVVTGELYGCHEVRVGDVAREDADELLAAFTDALRAQRDASPGDIYVDPPPLTCPDPFLDLSLVARTEEMRQAVLCVEYAPPDGAAPAQVRVRGADLLTLLADLGDPSRRTDPEIGDACLREQPYLHLVGATAWGDRVMLRGYCGVWELDDDGTRVQPSEASRRILERLVTRSGESP